jgi:Na+-transporting methylmalonyl-CoA/oxaloacetate decarboxylase gamma subunit
MLAIAAAVSLSPDSPDVLTQLGVGGLFAILILIVVFRFIGPVKPRNGNGGKPAHLEYGGVERRVQLAGEQTMAEWELKVTKLYQPVIDSLGRVAEAQERLDASHDQLVQSHKHLAEEVSELTRVSIATQAQLATFIQLYGQQLQHGHGRGHSAH